MKRVLLVLFFAVVFVHVHHQILAQATVSGKVTSTDDGSELPGVNVLVRGTANGTTTDASGNYTISVPPQAVLVFSYIGFVRQEIPVDNRTTINLQMRPDVTQLTEVVVTGYNTEQKREVISSIATVSSEKFKDIPVVGIDQALQGQAPGVQVTQSSGTPGGGIMVRIRGNTSISASNRPLFIVDGVPVEEGSLGTRDFGGQTDNALSTINPNDIESINILKDASAKALFGSRGANGVVIITTKRGKDGKTIITADAQRGIIDPTRKVDLLNSTELLQLQREAVVNAGGNPDTLGLIPGVTDAVNTDWLDEIFRRAIYEQYQLSASGGNERTRFYISGNYRNEEGVQLNNAFTRYTGALNLDHKATDKLSFGSNLILARTKNKRVKSDNFLDGVYSGALASLPYYSPYDEQGSIIGVGDPLYPGFPNFNPVGQALLPRFDTYTTKIVAGIYGEYAILQNLRFRAKFSVDYNAVNDDQFEPSTTSIGGDPRVGAQGYGVNSSATAATVINTNTLNYTRTFQEKHNVTATVGTEILQRTQRSSNVIGRLFPSDDFTYITSAGVVDQGSSFFVQNGLVSLFGEVKYDLNDTYLFSVTARGDGSSRFGEGRRFGFFPSASAGWRISAEPFMQPFANVINDLKLRASYGFTGNERIGDFAFLGTWSATSYNGASGIGPSSLSNPNLQWERTREANLGLDVSLKKGRINATIDVYSNLTDKLLFTEPYPLTTGFGGIQGNVGKISNKGIEIGLNTTNLDGNFKWTTSLNFSRNINEVVSLADTVASFFGYQAAGVSGTNVLLVGHPLGTFWGLNFLGVDPATGDAIYEDKDGEGEITPEDGMVIGNAQPDFIGGITNSFSFKGFDLNVFFQFSYGNEMVNLSNSNLLNAGENISVNQVRGALKRWQNPGDITSVPRYEYGNTFNNRHSSRFVEDASFLRLKNITLGYNLPVKLLTKIRLSSLRVYASATNLLTFTPYSGNDPEVSTLDGATIGQGIDLFTLPQVRTIMTGLTVGF